MEAVSFSKSSNKDAGFDLNLRSAEHLVRHQQRLLRAQLAYSKLVCLR